MKELNVSANQYLIDDWKTAKENEKGWADHRKAIEDQLVIAYQGDIDAVLEDLSKSTALTATASLGDLKVTVGESLSVTQVGATEFMQAYPAMNNILFKSEFKPIAKAILTTITEQNDMGRALFEVVDFKPKKPAFSLK